MMLHVDIFATFFFFIRMLLWWFPSSLNHTASRWIRICIAIKVLRHQHCLLRISFWWQYFSFWILGKTNSCAYWLFNLFFSVVTLSTTSLFTSRTILNFTFLIIFNQILMLLSLMIVDSCGLFDLHVVEAWWVWCLMVVSLMVRIVTSRCVHTFSYAIFIIFVIFFVFISCFIMNTTNIHLCLAARSLLSWASSLILHVGLSIPISYRFIILVVTIIIYLFIIVLFMLVLSFWFWILFIRILISIFG